MGRRILLLYISEDSGHHCASIAIENALKELQPDVRTLNINSFNYTNPILEKVINRTYMSVIKRTPELWDYLYDNPKVMKNAQRLRDLIHRFNTGKLKTLLEEFRPDGVVCTQAFPCGLIADYKKTFGVDIPLVGVLTDYAPHSYWIFDRVDRYIVPSEETGKKLIDNGADPSKIEPYGIPIALKFSKPQIKEPLYGELGLDERDPVILIMGGTQGLGPIKELTALLDRTSSCFQMAVACGTNRKLYNWLQRKRKKFRKRCAVFAFTEKIDALMQIASLIVTKPGGITTAEALAKGLPMLIVNPLPGQEAMNTKYLLKEGVAVKAESPEDAAVLLEELLYNSSKLTQMSERARALSKPDSSFRIAKLVLDMVKK